MPILPPTTYVVAVCVVHYVLCEWALTFVAFKLQEMMRMIMEEVADRSF